MLPVLVPKCSRLAVSYGAKKVDLFVMWKASLDGFPPRNSLITLIYLELKYVILVHSKNQSKVGNAYFQLSTIRIAGRDKQWLYYNAADRIRGA